MRYFKKRWFGKIGINMNEFGGPDVGVHLHMPGKTCALYRVHESRFETPGLWAYLRDLRKNGQQIHAYGVCPNCGMARTNWERRYDDYYFCGYCGRALMPYSKEAQCLSR